MTESMKYSVEIPKPDLTGFKLVLKVGSAKGTVLAYYNSSAEQVILNFNEDKWFLQSDESIYQSLSKVLCGECDSMEILNDEIWFTSKDGTKTYLEDPRLVDDFDSACWYWYDKYVFGSGEPYEVFYDIYENKYKKEYVEKYKYSYTEYPAEYSIQIPKLVELHTQIAEVQTPKGQLNVYSNETKTQVYLELENQWFIQSDNYTAESIATVLDLPLASLQSETNGFLGKYWSKLSETPVKVTVTV